MNCKNCESDKALVEAAKAALAYLSSPNFPHKSPEGFDRKPAVQALQMALDAAIMSARVMPAEKEMTGERISVQESPESTDQGVGGEDGSAGAVAVLETGP